MQFCSALLLAVATSVASAAVASRRPSDLDKRDGVAPLGQRWCNSGTPGDGGCERQGLHTYCSPLLRGAPTDPPVVKMTALFTAPFKQIGRSLKV
ncbi:hypothetical protein E4U57_003858 [Claviceps arundinis]|uniref:Uncharacterized protein n=1 Tax=Claviceps arundinis TaxID=1623583 RepID=A0A9P7N0B3_9HYPO|nr:hypothetical protein E4U57_003858 [Claviceps arundinis]KAG5978069.1 hypothetical protein E4U56_005548 [Claviceps arundinis]